jgi:ABC-type sulfate transport system permease component
VVFPALRSAIAAGSLRRSPAAWASSAPSCRVIPNQTLTAPVLITQLLNPSSFGSNSGPDEAAAVAAVLFGISAVVVLVTEQFVSRRSTERFFA